MVRVLILFKQARREMTRLVHTRAVQPIRLGEAVIDSGVARHPDLVENLLGGYDFVSSDPSGDGDGRDNDPSDPGIIRSGSSIRTSHGTHVAGTVAARGNNAQGVTGVGWTTKILPVRALNATGSGSSSDRSITCPGAP